MQLDQGEVILKVFYHHYTPYIFRLLQVAMVSLPFYFLIYITRGSFTSLQIFWSHILIVFLFVLVTIYVTLVYWLDRLIVTNKRLIFIDWKYLTVKIEYETELSDIQDVTSTERGVIALIPFFDYGMLEVKTASNKTTITFPEAPHPNNLKKFIQKVVLHKDSLNVDR